MTVGALRPVGETVDPFTPTRSFDWPEGYSPAWVDSGTTALGLALRVVVSESNASRPKVIAPAYTCPDVISAITWAGAAPVLVDTLRSTPWLDHISVEARLDEGIVAVVAPHFLGIRHPLVELRRICDSRGMQLIEDSAQLGPVSNAFSPEADLVVLSYGRGKPVPAGGGTLLYREALAAVVEAALTDLPKLTSSATAWRIRMMVQNAAFSKPGYGIGKRIPSLGVGETRFKPLECPSRLSDPWIHRIESVLAGWSHGAGSIARQLQDVVDDAGYVDVAGHLGWNGANPLLRFPVMAPTRGMRDRVVSHLDRLGLGATPFYRDILPRVPGIPHVEQGTSLENASEFAGRLFTLPCHSSVSNKDIQKIFDGLIHSRSTK